LLLLGGAHCVWLRARLAQSAERKALNLVVVGSSPTVGVFVGLFSKVVLIWDWLQKWTHWGLNPGPSACKADVIPLHHVPGTTFLIGGLHVACCGFPFGGATQTTPRGFEPLRAEPNGFRVHLLNRSDTVSWQQSRGMRTKPCETSIAHNSATVILCGNQIGPTRA
jgi:hypothetical protein